MGGYRTPTVTPAAAATRSSVSVRGHSSPWSSGHVLTAFAVTAATRN